MRESIEELLRGLELFSIPFIIFSFLDNPCCKNQSAKDNDEHTTVNKRRECIQRCTMHAERQAMNKRGDEYHV